MASIDPCQVCGQEGRDRITVHPECIPHTHDGPDGPPVIIEHDDYAAMLTELLDRREGRTDMAPGWTRRQRRT